MDAVAAFAEASGPARFGSIADMRRALASLPPGDDDAARQIRLREVLLTKPAGSLGRLETLTEWLGRWQGRAVPRLDNVEVVVFAGNHGVTARGVSPFPAEVTAQMVLNFEHGGAAINQLATLSGARLRVVPLRLDQPTRDLSRARAMDPADFLDAVNAGADCARPGTDLLCLGEMGIGNTTTASAICAALFGGTGADWVGRGTGIDDAGLARKALVVDEALALHGAEIDPLDVAMWLGGRELAAILGATLAARHEGIPVMLDGFVCSAAAAPLLRVRSDALDHTQIAHVSAEAGHARLVACLGKRRLFDLDMRLGEGSGAALAVLLMRAALACHGGMATFAQAGVSDRPA